MLKLVNRAYVALLLALALGGVFLTMLTTFPDLLPFDAESAAFSGMRTTPLLSLGYVPSSISPEDSPYPMNFTVNTPALAATDFLYIEAYSEGKVVAQTDCFEELDYDEQEYEGKTSLDCVLYLPYTYGQEEEYNIYAILYMDTGDFYAGPYPMKAVWAGYENFFWGAFVFIFLLVAGVYILVVIPVGLFVLYHGMKRKPKVAEWYTLGTLLNPFRGRKTWLQKLNSFLVSPYFWGLEMAGIFLILIYMFFSADAWKSGSGLVSFILSGLLAFVAPFLWCSMFWFAEFREREPLRVLVTFFLWGCLAALMAFGINTLAGVALEIVGLGFLTSLLVAPPVEEIYKGTGLALLAEHREYNSIEDGLVFGFVIGMGFSFIEDWVYLLQNPMGGDILGWFLVFILRSILFSANHGVFTAITGGFIGLLAERKFAAPALGLIPGGAVAAFLHAMHNSGGLLEALLGVGGMLAYCCILIPLFDYGGLLLLVLIFAWAVLRKKE